jgi:hypothetical protein
MTTQDYNELERVLGKIMADSRNIKGLAKELRENIASKLEVGGEDKERFSHEISKMAS